MAIIKTIQIHQEDGISKVQNYIENPEKTDLGNLAIKLELEYDQNPEKTTLKESSGFSHPLVDSYKCSSLNAAGQFYDARHLYESRHTTRTYKKKKPVVAIHLIQSFPEDETLDPRLVHQIGMELAAGLKDAGIGDYQAVVCTHMNTKHLHNHILLNAFSTDGTRKFADNKNTIQRIRDLSDELSMKYGLLILQEEDIKPGRFKSQAEHHARLNGISWKEQFRIDIKDCIHSSNNFEEWYSQMKEIGYTFRETSDGTPISISDGTNNIRLQRLGEAYTFKEITKAIAAGSFEKPLSSLENERGNLRSDKGEPSDFSVTTMQQSHNDWIPYFEKVQRFTDYGRRRSDLEMILLTLINYLKRLLERMKRALQKRFDQKLQEQISRTENQLHNLEKTLGLIQEYAIQNPEEIKTLKKSTGHNLSDARKTIEALTANEHALETATETLSENSLAESSPCLLSTFSPMTPIQRRDLFSLSKDSGWRIRTGFDCITAGEATEAIDFLKSRRNKKEKLSKVSKIPAIFSYDYQPLKAAPDTITKELQAVTDLIRITKRKEEQLSRQYQDLIQLEKIIPSARDEYARLDGLRKEYASVHLYDERPAKNFTEKNR